MSDQSTNYTRAELLKVACHGQSYSIAYFYNSPSSKKLDAFRTLLLATTRVMAHLPDRNHTDVISTLTDILEESMNYPQYIDMFRLYTLWRKNTNIA